MTNPIFRFSCSLLLLGLWSPFLLDAAPVVLYEGRNLTMPDRQGWIYQLQPRFRNSARQTRVKQATNLNTMRRLTDHAGYFARAKGFNPHPKIPDDFNREQGYQIGFTIQLPTEQHAREDRAGFSVIALSHDLQGIELGFWTNEIFAQSAEFTHAEDNANLPFRLANEYVDFVLEIRGANYILSGNGTEILTGPLRDYSGFDNPYNIADFLFFGDGTDSASASVNLRSVWIDTELPRTDPPPSTVNPEAQPQPPLADEEVVFTVDAEASSLTVSGLVLANPLQDQGDGALTTTFTGQLHTTLSDEAIRFNPESRVDANPSGEWKPLPGGADGAATADFGAIATLLVIRADAAGREIEFEISSDTISLNSEGTEFPLSGITLDIPTDSLAAIDLATDGLLPIRTSQSLADFSAQNTSPGLGTLSVEDHIQTITLPIEVVDSVQVATLNNVTLRFTGTLVASRPLAQKTNPAQEGNQPPTLAISIAGGGALRLTWEAMVGRTYQIEQSNDLIDWLTLGEATTAQSAEGSHEIPADSGARFFRILLLPSP